MAVEGGGGLQRSISHIKFDFRKRSRSKKVIKIKFQSDQDHNTDLVLVVAAVHHPLLGGVDEVLDGLVDGVRHVLVRAGDLDGAAAARREPAHGQPEEGVTDMGI